jgi:hypothetical protein
MAIRPKAWARIETLGETQPDHDTRLEQKKNNSVYDLLTK